MKNEVKRAKIFICTFFIFFLTMFIAVAVIAGVFKYTRTFTVSKWMESEESRHHIVNNMLSKYEIVGMTESEIVSLLGEETELAPESFKHPRGKFPDRSNLTYYLGVDFMDNNWLIITMENGRAISYEIGAT